MHASWDSRRTSSLKGRVGSGAVAVDRLIIQTRDIKKVRFELVIAGLAEWELNILELVHLALEGSVPFGPAEAEALVETPRVHLSPTPSHHRKWRRK